MALAVARAAPRLLFHVMTVGFASAAAAVATIFAVGLIGFVSARRGLLSPQGVRELSILLVDFILPAQLFSAMYAQYEPSEWPLLLTCGAAQVTFFLSGCVLVMVLHRLSASQTHRGTLYVLASLQNIVYLPLPLAIALLSAADAQRAGFYIGCFVLFFNPILWALGPNLLRSAGAAPAARPYEFLRRALNPPFLATLAGLLLKQLTAATGVALPSQITEALKLVGAATPPLAIIVLGAVLAHTAAGWPEKRSLAIVAGVKLVALPLIALAYLRFSPPSDPVFAFILMVQAAAPPATNTLLLAQRHGGDVALVARTLFTTYLLAVVTLPFWLLFI